MRRSSVVELLPACAMLWSQSAGLQNSSQTDAASHAVLVTSHVSVTAVPDRKQPREEEFMSPQGSRASVHHDGEGMAAEFVVMGQEIMANQTRSRE